MELWIRSQDKERLFKIDKLGIQEAKDNFLVVLYTDYDEWWRLGIYATKERALEILDEIQDLMSSLTDSDLKIIQYDMPSE